MPRRRARLCRLWRRLHRRSLLWLWLVEGARPDRWDLLRRRHLPCRRGRHPVRAARIGLTSYRRCAEQPQRRWRPPAATRPCRRRSRPRATRAGEREDDERQLHRQRERDVLPDDARACGGEWRISQGRLRRGRRPSARRRRSRSRRRCRPRPWRCRSWRAARAGASLTPSPTIATRPYFATSASIAVDLVLGQQLGADFVDAGLRGDGLGGRRGCRR